MRVEWRRTAYFDAIAIVDHIDVDNPIAALAVFEELQHQIAMLAQHPQLGRPGRVSGTRELVINRTPYVAAYLVSERVVTILRILHGAQRWPKKMR